MVKRSFPVEIAGQQLSIRSDAGSEYVQQLADYVDAQLRPLLQGRRNTPSMQRVALLVAIQLADELFRERDLHRRFRSRVAGKLESLRAALDAHEANLVPAAQQSPAPADPTPS
ncbi:MAG: cell division protein ZapA [Deltaproteobacteria bacterium]|nr:cell division protein ZapA [Deltaproteobacteria bacterium]